MISLRTFGGLHKQESLCFGGAVAFAFCGKLNRLYDEEPRQYDVADAVTCLHEYLRATGRQTVGVGRVREWCGGFNKNMTDEVPGEVDNGYYRAHWHRVIDWRA